MSKQEFRTDEEDEKEEEEVSFEPLGKAKPKLQTFVDDKLEIPEIEDKLGEHSVFLDEPSTTFEAKEITEPISFTWSTNLEPSISYLSSMARIMTEAHYRSINFRFSSEELNPTPPNYMAQVPRNKRKAKKDGLLRSMKSDIINGFKNLRIQNVTPHVEYFHYSEPKQQACLHGNLYRFLNPDLDFKGAKSKWEKGYARYGQFDLWDRGVIQSLDGDLSTIHGCWCRHEIDFNKMIDKALEIVNYYIPDE